MTWARAERKSSPAASNTPVVERDLFGDLVDLRVHAGDGAAHDVGRQQQPTVGQGGRVADTAVVGERAALAAGGHRQLVFDASGLVLPASGAGQEPTPHLDLGGERSGRGGACREVDVGPVSSFVAPVVQPPRQQERADEAKIVAAAAVRSRQGGAQVVVFGVELGQP